MTRSAREALIDQAGKALAAGLVGVEVERTINFLARRAGVTLERDDVGEIWTSALALA
jgi:hypothetical protein